MRAQRTSVFLSNRISL